MGYGQGIKTHNISDNQAVVLGLCPTGLAVLRALGRNGITVKGIDKDRWAVGFFSRYCKRIGHFDIDKPEGAQSLMEALTEYGRRFSKKPVLIATSDDFLVFLAKYSESLRRFYSFPKINEEMLNNFLNKKKFYEICSRNGTPTAKTFFLSEDKIESMADNMPYPCIFKPIYTHIWDQKLKGLKAFKVNSPSEFIERYNIIKSLGLADNIMVQEVIEGPTNEIYIFASYFDKNSNPIGIFTGRKIRQYPADFGNTTLAESYNCKEVSAMAINLLKKMDYHGLCDVEFKRDAKDDRLKIVEINPRPGRWYGLVEESGVNLVYTAYRDLTCKSNDSMNHVMIPGKRWIFWERDIFTVMNYIRRKIINVKGYYSSIKGSRVNAIYAKDDKVPALIFPFNQILMLFKKKVQCAR